MFVDLIWVKILQTLLGVEDLLRHEQLHSYLYVVFGELLEIAHVSWREVSVDHGPGKKLHKVDGWVVKDLRWTSGFAEGLWVYLEVSLELVYGHFILVWHKT